MGEVSRVLLVTFVLAFITLPLCFELSTLHSEEYDCVGVGSAGVGVGCRACVARRLFHCIFTGSVTRARYVCNEFR